VNGSVDSPVSELGFDLTANSGSTPFAVKGRGPKTATVRGAVKPTSSSGRCAAGAAGAWSCAPTDGTAKNVTVTVRKRRQVQQAGLARWRAGATEAGYR
jgi:hypothetical protein